jgi:hypothetical protein
MKDVNRLRPFAVVVALLVLAAVPVAAQATDSHAPRGARDWLPSDEWVRSQWRPYDEATLNHLLHTNRDELATWLDDRRTLGQLARKRGFKDQRALARGLVAAATTIRPAPGGVSSSGARSNAHPGPPRAACAVPHLPLGGDRPVGEAPVRREHGPLQGASRQRPLAAPDRGRRRVHGGAAARLAAAALRRARPPPCGAAP